MRVWVMCVHARVVWRWCVVSGMCARVREWCVRVSGVCVRVHEWWGVVRVWFVHIWYVCMCMSDVVCVCVCVCVRARARVV